MKQILTETIESGIEEPKNKAEEILSSFGLKEGEPVPASIIQAIINKHEAEITEGLARNFYHNIRESLYWPRAQAISSPIYVLRKPNRVTTPQKKELDFAWFLKSKSKSRDDRWRQNDEPKLIFTYGVNTQKIDKENERAAVTAYEFTGYDAFELQKIMYGLIPWKKLDDKDYVGTQPDIRRSTNPAGEPASYENMLRFLKLATKPAEVFKDANARIDRIWQRYKFPPEDAGRLKQAIYEFGNFDFTDREGGLAMIGKCLTVPGDFERLARRRVGLRLQRCELSGAKQAYRSYSPEEKAELDAEKEGMIVHEASIYENQVIIDWTSRQFNEHLPLPEIVDLEDDERLKDRIEIKN